MNEGKVAMRWRPLMLVGGLCVAAAAFSQTTGGSITGVITDLDGGTFPMAFVQLKNTGNAGASNVVSMASGRYNITKLAEGSYELSVNVPGMKAYKKTGIVVRPGQALEIDVRLEDGPSLRTLGEDPASLIAAFSRPSPPNGPTPRAPDGQPDLSGLWLAGPAALELDMLPWADSLTRERIESNSKDYPPSRCLPSGAVPVLRAGFFRLVQTPVLMMMVFENDTPGYRQIFLDGRAHPKDFGPTWLGHSTGKWDDDSLVIDSVGFRDRGWLDVGDYPHTEALHTTQRFRRLDLGHLQIQITLEDAGAYRKPATTNITAVLALDQELLEYICNENNKDVEHLVGK
jgi:hypothetical protein